MSASTAVARRALNRNPYLRHSNIARSLLSTVANGAVGRRPLSRQMDGLAIMVSSRSIGTEHHRVDRPPSGPPPGFNADEAKKPPRKKDNNNNTSGPATLKSSLQTPTVSPESKANASSSSSRSSTAKAGGKHDEKEASPTELATMTTTRENGLESAEARKEAEKKLTVWQKVKKEAHHYWDGTKLLATEAKISWRLALKMAAGYELSRRENRQLQRTVQDLGRLVPFSVFVIVPLGELFLPIALRIFPNMLPSTYEGQKSKDAKASLLRATRKEVSQFLRSTLKETGLPLSVSTTQKEEFTNFFRKIRSTGEKPTDEDVIRVCKIFRDDLTLDNLSRPQLVSICRYMNLNTFGTDMMLRYQIRHRMRQIKRDDRAISFEGVDTLTVSELQTACASRGVPTHGVSPARMRRDLQTWLDLRLREGVPSTLLVLSNAYMYSQYIGDTGGQMDALTGVLSSIPEELLHEMELEVHDAEGQATNKQRLEVLKEQEELIEEENEQNEESQSTGYATPRDVDNIDERDERAAEAQRAGIEASQAGEMVDAEREQAVEERMGKSVDAENKKE